MNAAILGLFIDEPGGDASISSTRSDPFAIEVDRADYLDGGSIYHGEAIDLVESEVQRPTIVKTEGGEGDRDFSIVTETESEPTPVRTEYLADFGEPAYVGVGTSQAEYLFRWIGGQVGSPVERASIDVSAFAEGRGRTDQPWQVGWRKADPEDEDQTVGAAALYHDDADMGDAPRVGLTQFGFDYNWDGTPVRGTITQSGYVAVFQGVNTVEAFGRWLREEVLPHAYLEEEAVTEAEIREDAKQAAGDGDGDGDRDPEDEDERFEREADPERAREDESQLSLHDTAEELAAGDEEAEEESVGVEGADVGRFADEPDGALREPLDEPVECSDEGCPTETLNPYIHDGDPYCLVCYDYRDETGELASDGGQSR